jgi:hypothetical protein
MQRDLDPRFRELRAVDLQALDDSQLAPAVYEHVLHHCIHDLENELELVAALSPAVRAVYATTLLDNEILNGGFNQFFWNSTGQFALLALEGLQLIGASEHAAITRAAIATYEAERVKHEEFRHIGTKDAFAESYQHTELVDLDDRYCALDGLPDILTRFIREHTHLFNSPGRAA